MASEEEGKGHPVSDNGEATSASADHYDYLKSPLNPCSIETIPYPIPVVGDSKTPSQSQSQPQQRRAWPCMVACYQLEEAKQQRVGRLDLFSFPVPPDDVDLTDDDSSSPPKLSLGTPMTVFDGKSGILDGKFFGRKKVVDSEGDDLKNDTFFYASAHSTGEIRIFSVDPTESSSYLASETEQKQPFEVSCRAISESSDDGALCLALSWEANEEPSRIVSSYSDGTAAIHKVGSLVGPDASAELELETRWNAHSIFRQPAEVWSCCFLDDSTVMTAGEDGSVKVWDTRLPFTNAVHTMKLFDAGATALSPHPRIPHIVACGSYDETLALWDSRKFPEPISRTPPLGGGIWRCKWHPEDDQKMLLACMHYGCRVMTVDSNLRSELLSHCSMKCIKQFTNHESMAYGADWLVHTNETADGSVPVEQFEAAVTCSFYDRAVYVWDSSPEAST